MKEPLWMLLLGKWNDILYQRDKIFPNYDLSRNILEIGCGRRGWLSLMLKSYFECFTITTDIETGKVRKARDIARASKTLMEEKCALRCIQGANPVE